MSKLCSSFIFLAFHVLLEHTQITMITFSPHTRDDIQLRVKWLNNHQAVLYAIDQPDHVSTEELQRNWFDDYEKKIVRGEKKFFTILSDDKRIGFMGLSNINMKVGNASVFIIIGEDGYRGRGIGRESMDYLISCAFKELKLKSLYLQVDKSNEPAINLYNKIGFQKLSEDGKFISMILSSSMYGGVM